MLKNNAKVNFIFIAFSKVYHEAHKSVDNKKIYRGQKNKRVKLSLLDKILSHFKTFGKGWTRWKQERREQAHTMLEK